MYRKTILTVLASGTLVLVGVFAALSYSAAQAATPAAASADALQHGRGFGGYSNEDLAEALGITIDELNSAYDTATDAALEQAVADGLITQTQADQIRERGTAFPFGGHRSGWLNESDIDFDALLAEALGISTEDLRAAYNQAAILRIDRAVSEGTLTEEQADLMKGRNALYADTNFQTAMQAAFTDAVGQAVTEGLITQAQADQILSNADNMGFAGRWGMDGPRGPRGLGPRGD